MADPYRFQIIEFKLENMVMDPSIVMIAKRGSGKSWITREILYHYRHKIPCGVIISPTDNVNPFYKDFFPDLFIHYEIQANTLGRIMNRQKSMKEKAKRRAASGKKIDPSAILVMDDCLADKRIWKKDPNIRIVLLNGRHYKLTYIMTMQDPIGMEPTLRSNFDYIFMLKDDTETNKIKLMRNYAGMFSKIDDFDRVFRECTKDYGCMVVDNRKPADNINEKVFWFKARKRSFMFGSKEFKEWHKKYYNPKFIPDDCNMGATGNPFLIQKKGAIDIRIEKV
jgi:hypothetical protein